MAVLIEEAGGDLTLGTVILELLRLLDCPCCASCSKKFCQRSDSVSFVAGLESVKYSACKAGVLGVRWKGDEGILRDPELKAEVPGRASPACSRCSSFQFRRAAISCRT